MADIVKITERNLADVLKGGQSGALGVGAPFEEPIYLVDVHVAGTTHVKGIDQLVEGLHEGDRLSFVREKDNRFDKMAIKVMDADGNRLGYVPCDNNEILARLMDGGKLLYGEVRKKELVDERWNKVSMRVFLDD